ncbi:MAG TPA: phospholipase D family protein, partial [Flavobacteriaceae bacterium]|nr:phospholipase D family protein [Flavobacteriaceae bacterium]
MKQNRIKFIGILLLFIGIVSCKNDKKIPLQKEDFCAKIHDSKTISLSKELQQFEDKLNTKTGVYVLENGTNSMITRAWLCEAAEKTIDIQYFIFSTDNVGLIACDYLVRAADKGIKIRILVDDFMVNTRIEDVLTLNSHKNISIKIYNPGVNIGKNLIGKITKFATDFRGANQRMHNKTFIVDDKVVITGGRNIADEYFDYDHDYNFRDRDVLLIGKNSKTIKKSFTNFWNSEHSVDVTSLVKENLIDVNDEKRFDNLHQYACNPDNFWPQIRSKIENFSETIHKIKNSDKLVWLDSVSFVSDIPGKNTTKKGLGGGGKTTSTLIELIKNAKKSIDIQTPYLITTELSRNVFANAIKRGVKIRILTNSLASTDNLEAFASYQTDRKKLLKIGVEIYEFKPDAAIRKEMMTNELQQKLKHTPIFGLHAKSMIVDNKITVIGTFNLDPRSANLNTECLSIIYSDKISANVLKGFNKEFKLDNSWRITLEFNPDNKVKRSKRIKTWTRKILPKGIL